MLDSIVKLTDINNFTSKFVNYFKSTKALLLLPYNYAQETIRISSSKKKIIAVQDAYQKESTNNTEFSNNKNLGKAYQIIEELQKGGAVGLHHLGPLSSIIDRPIRIFDQNGKSVCVIGKGKENVVDVEYHRPTNFGSFGHWTLPKAVEAPRKSYGRNNCLFDVVSAQTQKNADELREETAKVMKKNIVLLASVVRDIERLFRYKKVSLYLGGASYVGRNSNDSATVIDMSQNVSGHGHSARGHPRGHASYPDATDYLDSVEKYSMGSGRDYPKSGFLSRDDQNDVVHRILTTHWIQEALRDLNNGSTREVIKIDSTDIPGPLPLMGEWSNGIMFKGPMNIERVTILLQHHQGQQNNPDYNVHIHTCYPMSH